MSKNTKRLIPFAILGLLILVVYLTNTHEIFTINWLREKELSLTHYTRMHPILSPLIYLGVYIVSVVLVIPDSTILTLLGGMIFPIPEGLILAVISETMGATIFFAIFNSTFSAPILRKEHAILQNLRHRFGKNSVSYLLFLRLSHFIPYWLTNIAAAYFRVDYWRFIWTTCVGVLPLTYIVANAGHSLSQAFQEHRIMTLSDIFTPQIKFALLILGMVALFPIIFKKWKKK